MNAQDGRHTASFEVRGQTVGLNFLPNVAGLLERLTEDEQDEAIASMVALIDETVIGKPRQPEAASWETSLKVIEVRAGSAYTCSQLLSVSFVRAEDCASVGVSLVSNGKLLRPSDDDNDDDPSGPPGGRRRTRKGVAEQVAGELQARADEQEHEPCEAAHFTMNRLLCRLIEHGPHAQAHEGARVHLSVSARPWRSAYRWVFAALSAIVGYLSSAIRTFQHRDEDATLHRAQLSAVRVRLALLYSEFEVGFGDAPARNSAGGGWTRLVPIVVEIKKLTHALIEPHCNVEPRIFISYRRETSVVVETLLARVEFIVCCSSHTNDVSAADGLPIVHDICDTDCYGTPDIGAHSEVLHVLAAKAWHDRPHGPWQDESFVFEALAMLKAGFEEISECDVPLAIRYAVVQPQTRWTLGGNVRQ